MNAARRPLFFITSGQHPDERADVVNKYFAKQIDLLLAYIRDGKVVGHLRSLHLGPCPLNRPDGVHGGTAHAGPGTRRCKFTHVLRALWQKEGVAGGGL